MTTQNPPVWTAALRAACVRIVDNCPAGDLTSRAGEIANGARIGQTLTPMNVEFIGAMRSRFDPYRYPPEGIAAQRHFDDLWRDAWDAANPPPAPTFTALGWDGVDPMTIKIDGFTLTASTVTDDVQDAPWLREDGHGPVRTAPRGNETEGERSLNDGARRYFYDWTAALAQAVADGWGPGTPEEAVQADFDRLAAWCRGDWGYVGVCVVATRNGHPLTGAFGNALWGIESDSGAYFAEVADDLVSECLEEAREALADIIEGDAA